MKLRGQLGGSLVGVMVATGIAIFVTFMVMRFVQQSVKVHATMDDADRMRDIKTLIRSNLSCSATLGASPSCSSTAATMTHQPESQFYQLIGKRGNTIGEPFGSQMTKLGRWAIRASCVKTPDQVGLLVFASQKTSNDANAQDFKLHRTTGQPLAWRSIFLMEQELCADHIENPSGGGGGGGGGNPLTSDPDIHTSPLSNGNPGGNQNCGSTLDGLLAVRSLGAMNNFKTYTAEARCPDGQRAIGGGADCGTGKKSWHPGVAIVQSIAGGGGKGQLMASRPSADGKGWLAACCIEGGVSETTHVFVICGNN